MHYVSCIRRYNALMNKVIWISGVTVSTRAKALVLTVTPLMHINLFISALYLRMHSTRALSYTYPIRKSFFAVNLPLKLFRAIVANADIGSLKYLHTFHKKCLYQMLVKFERNCMVQTTLNVGAF